MRTLVGWVLQLLSAHKVEVVWYKVMVMEMGKIGSVFLVCVEEQPILSVYLV